MSDLTPQSSLPFSIENFIKIFEKSQIKQFLSAMELEQIRSAIEEKDQPFLRRLYSIVTLAKVADEKIVRDFVMTKNRMMDDFMVEATGIKKKFVEEPRKKRLASAEMKEQETAENILNQL